MDMLIALIIVLYGASTAFYIAYLFRQKISFHRSAHALLMAGFICHSLAIGIAAVQSGRIPVRNLHETLIAASWAVSGFFLIFQYRYKLRILGVYVAPLAAGTMIVAATLSREPVQAKSLLNNIWLAFHILSIFVGEAAFALACGLGILYLLQENAIKTKRHGFLFKRLPSLDVLDNAGYACIATGFTLMTIGLVTGSVYAKAVWGRFWSWDPKEVWSVITWLLYAALLHQRLTVGWRGRRAAMMAVVGFAAVLFTFLGVNFLLQGHHGEFTRW